MLPDEMLIVKYLPFDEDVRIKPLADLHIGSRQFDERLWQTWKASIMPKDLIVLVGDLIDNGIKTSVSNTYEQTMMPSAQKEWLYKELEPFAEQILCAVGGNHEKRNVREVDEDPLYTVLCRLKREDVYRSNACFVKLRFGEKGARMNRNGVYRPTYNMVVLHGSGGGMYIGSSANKSERFAMAIEGADLMITGHTHKPITFPTARIAFDNKNTTMNKKQLTVVTCSSFLGYGGYALEKMLPPTATVDQQIILSARGKRIDVIQSMGGGK